MHRNVNSEDIEIFKSIETVDNNMWGRKKDGDYEEFVKQFSKRFGGKREEDIRALLANSEELRNVYNIMEKDRVAPGFISEAFRSGLEAVSEKGRYEAHDFVVGIARRMARYGAFEDVIEEMRREDLFDDREYQKLLKKVREERKRGIKALKGRTAESLMERVEENRTSRRAAVFLPLFISAYFLLKSFFGGGFIGAVIGGGVVDLNVIYGVIFLLLGLAMAHFYYR